MTNTMTISEANKKVDDHIQRAMKKLPSDASLTNPQHFRESPCDDPSDGGPRGRVTASRDYQIAGLSSENIPDYFDTLKAWWLDNGYRLLDNEPRYEFLWVEDKQDAIRVTLKANDKGELYIIASSPCVWPDGTPAPEDS